MGELADSIPKLYAALLPPELLKLSLEEPRSSCADCAMCRPSVAPGAIQFLPSTKCCTFWPKLPNYLVGCLLSDTTGRFTEGQRRVRAQILAGEGATPLGIGPTTLYQERLHANRSAEFGRNEALLCPYFEKGSGGCSIWAYRDSDCTSFFCKFESGRSFEVWRQFGALLALLEQKLSVYAAAEAARCVDFETEPEAFYLRAAEAITQLTADDLLPLIGEAWDRRREELDRAVAELTQLSSPQKVHLARGLQVLQDDVWTSIVTYNEYDAVVVSSLIYTELKAASGAPVALAELEPRFHGMLAADSSHDLLEGLVAHEVLVSA